MAKIYEKSLSLSSHSYSSIVPSQFLTFKNGGSMHSRVYNRCRNFEVAMVKSGPSEQIVRMCSRSSISHRSGLYLSMPDGSCLEPVFD